MLDGGAGIVSLLGGPVEPARLLGKHELLGLLCRQNMMFNAPRGHLHHFYSRPVCPNVTQELHNSEH